MQWFSSLDENGRTYFYDEDSSESVWELPDLSASSELEVFFTVKLHLTTDLPYFYVFNEKIFLNFINISSGFYLIVFDKFKLLI